MAKTNNTNPRSYKRTVDWGAIGKQFTDAIVDTKTKQTETAKKGFEAQKERATVEKEREDKRQTYKEQEEAYEGKALALRSDVRSVYANVPSLQQITLDITNQAVTKRNDMYEQFKKGNISERDWLVARQNVTDGFKTYFGLVKDYGAVKENAEKSIAAGGSPAITSYFVGQLESLQNTENLDVSFTDNGQWNATYNNAIDNKETTVPLAQLNVFGRVNFDGFNVEQVASTIDQQLGTELKGGKYTQTQGKIYGKRLETLITEKIEGPANAPTTAALIMDVLNGTEYSPEGGFKLVMDESEYTEDGNNILIVTETTTGVPTFQIPENAMSSAREYLAERVKGLENSSFKVIRVKGKDPKQPPLPNDKVQSELKKVVKTSKRIIKEIQDKPKYKLGLGLTDEDRIEIEKQEQYISNAESVLSNKTWTNADFVREEDKADGKIIGVKIKTTGSMSEFN